MRWWRVFIDKLTGKRKDPGVVGPRRRKAARYGYEVKLAARCSSWPKLLELFTGDVSEGGLYIPTDETAEVGESVEVDLTLPDGGSFHVTGKVVNIISQAQAERFGRRAGLGVMLDSLTGEPAKRFQELLAAAREQTPVPELDEDDLEIVESMSGRFPALPTPQPEPPMPPAHPGKRDPVSFHEPGVKPPSSTAEPVAAPAHDHAAPAPRPPDQSVLRKAPAVHINDPEPIVGIDLGTTYTSVAAVVGKKVTMLPWSDGAKAGASVLSFPEKHKCIVGAEARARLASDPPHTISSPKRLLGRMYDDREIQGFIGSAPYRTLAGPDGSVVVDVWGQQYAVTQLCAYIMEEARRVAEVALGREVNRCVMTVPVSFDEARARVFRRAGEMARLDVVALIDEPSAAALANRFDPGFGGVVGVYDFGGGTFDFSVVDVSQGDFQVLATAGDTWLGGDDFDVVIAEAAANQFWRMHKVDLRKQAVEWQKLLFACEQAKRMLSVDDDAAIYVPNVLRSASGMVDLNIGIDRATFDRACKPVVDRSLATCDEALDLVGMKPGDLSAVYLSGGTTYIPTVREGLARHFGVPVRTGVPPEHAVCLGAAIHGAQMQFRAATTLDARGD